MLRRPRMSPRPTCVHKLSICLALFLHSLLRVGS